MNTLAATIIGDRFMVPERFSRALAAVPGLAIASRTVELAWPDEPMTLNADSGDPAGLREFVGSQAELANCVADARVLITHLAPVGARLLDAAPKLEMIGVARGGPVNVDVAAARARAVKLVNAPGRNASAVAEFTVAAILAATRRLAAGHSALAAGRWRGDLYRADETGPELGELTVGLVGFGRIGARLAPLLAPFGCRLLAHDPFVAVPADSAAEQVDFDTVLAQSDVVSLHARVTDDTRGLFDAAAFARMKPGAYFINTARGPLVDYQALYAALASKRLAGCALDTFADEPPAGDDPLLGFPNVVVSPHIAGASTRTIDRSAAMMAEEVRRHALGLPAQNPVD